MQASCFFEWSPTIHRPRGPRGCRRISSTPSSCCRRSRGWHSVPSKRRRPISCATASAGWCSAGRRRLVLLVGVSGAVAALGDTLFPASSLADGLLEDLSPTLSSVLAPPALAPGHRGLGFWLPDLARDRSSFAVRPTDGFGRLALALGALVLIQIAVGLINIALLAPVCTQLVHLLIADATWISLTLLALSSPTPTSDANLVP